MTRITAGDDQAGTCVCMTNDGDTVPGGGTPDTQALVMGASHPA